MLFVSVSFPGYNYINSKLFLKNNQLNPPPINEFFPNFTIVLPVRDESLVIKRKLKEIMNMEYPLSKINILIIDSLSKDSTSDIAREYLSKTMPSGKWRIENLYYPGKSLAVNHALDIIETDFFIMMDTESLIDKDAFNLLARWFVNPKIGAVCGQLSILGTNNKDSYRSRFNILREAESILDSTPIFEGSICAFRKNALCSKKINPDINADDTQLALLIRKNGFRSIMDPSIKFYEPSYKSSFFNNSREIRRAQGLSRVLWNNRGIVYGENYQFKKIYYNQFYFYLIFPWTFITGIIALMSSLIYKLIYFSQGSQAFISLFLIISIFLFFSKTVRRLINGILTLLRAHILILFNQSLHIWVPDQDFREAFSKYNHGKR